MGRPRFSAAPPLYPALEIVAQGDRKPRCADTGLTVPECSCRRCLEAMLREFRPALLGEEIVISPRAADGRDGPGTGRREAA